jgi:hypothetical protein
LRLYDENTRFWLTSKGYEDVARLRRQDACMHLNVQVTRAGLLTCTDCGKEFKLSRSASVSTRGKSRND